jgi:hypothetical protein
VSSTECLNLRFFRAGHTASSNTAHSVAVVPVEKVGCGNVLAAIVGVLGRFQKLAGGVIVRLMVVAGVAASSMDHNCIRDLED